MTAHIITIILVLTDILVYYTFLKTVLKRKSEKPLDYFLFVVLFILTSISTLFLNDYLPVKLLVNFILKFVISFIVFKVSFKKILLSNLAYTGVLYSIEFTLLLIVEQLCNVTGLSEIPVSDAVISELICQFTVLIVVFVLNIAYRKGYIRRERSLPFLNYSKCTAGNEASVTVRPDGGIVRCPQLFGDDQLTGTVKKGIINRDIIQSWKQSVDAEVCWDCTLYANCNRLVRCPDSVYCHKAPTYKKRFARMIEEIYDSTMSAEA